MSRLAGYSMPTPWEVEDYKAGEVLGKGEATELKEVETSADGGSLGITDGKNFMINLWNGCGDGRFMTTIYKVSLSSFLSKERQDRLKEYWTFAGQFHIEGKNCFIAKWDGQIKGAKSAYRLQPGQYQAFRRYEVMALYWIVDDKDMEDSNA